MYKIMKREVLVPNMIYMKIEAPEVAQKANAGQFIILRVDDVGERFPISLAGWDRDEGTLEITYQIMGKSTMRMAALSEGDMLMDVVGPLGRPTEIEDYGTVLCACGSFGIGPMLTVIRALKEKKNRVLSVLEAENESMLFWEDRLKEVSDETWIVTGDLNNGRARQASQFVHEYLEAGNRVDRVIAFGRVFMMMGCSNATRPFGVKTVVSLTPIMVDGTGMCGCCRVSIGGETKFACVDGPEFDGHSVDWVLLIKRRQAYLKEEAMAYALWEIDNLNEVAKLSQLSKRTSVMLNG